MTSSFCNLRFVSTELAIALAIAFFSVGFAPLPASATTGSNHSVTVRLISCNGIMSRPVLTAEQKRRKEALHRCLSIQFTKQVDADVLRPWSIMHGLIAYGQDTQIISRGRSVNAVDYLCNNGIGDDRRMLFVSNGRLQTRVGRGVQGHEAQFLAMLAQCNVPADKAIVVDGQQFTVRDLIRHEQLGCQSNTELTFRLIGLSHYLRSDAVWKNKFGEQWSIARLINEELQQPVNDGACGGTHRLMSLSYAVANRRLDKKPIDGHWYRANKFVEDFQKYALSFQRETGEFSTDWFKSKTWSNEVRLRMYSTGHITEWLVYSLPQERLQDPEITKAVDFLITLLMSAPGNQWRGSSVGPKEVGPRGHAIHALAMYQQRVFGKSDFTALAQNPNQLTERTKQTPPIVKGQSPYANASHGVQRTNPQQPQRTQQNQPLLPVRRGIFGRRR